MLILDYNRVKRVFSAVLIGCDYGSNGISNPTYLLACKVVIEHWLDSRKWDVDFDGLRDSVNVLRNIYPENFLAV